MQIWAVYAEKQPQKVTDFEFCETTDAREKSLSPLFVTLVAAV